MTGNPLWNGEWYADPEIGTGAGHHSVFKGPGEDKWYIVYHRHPIGATTGNHRVTCIDRLYFEEDGSIRPVKMTFEGVKALSKARKHSKKR